MKMFYIPKIMKKLKLSSFNNCDIDNSAKVVGGCELTRVKMGKYSYCGENTKITDTVIGSFCSIGDNVSIGGGNHPLETVSTSPAFLKGRNILGINFAEISYAPSKDVYIGNDVWIGTAAYIKGGVTIGDGAVVGSHAVVTHDVDPYSIVAGVPAIELRKRFAPDICRKLMEIAWWNWDDEKLRKCGGGDFCHLKNCLKILIFDYFIFGISNLKRYI